MDLSPRARSILESADYVIAEDTRRALRLYREAAIPLRSFVSFFEHNEEERVTQVLGWLKEGKDVALISDAGTPLIADPGFRLVKACHTLGISVSPIPGPSAPMAALSVAGIAPLPFTFLGFLPRDALARRTLFARYAEIPGSLVFFERGDRLAESIRIAYEVLGERDLAICRELTKTHEEILRLSLSAPIPVFLGEITVVVGQAENVVKTPEEEIVALLSAEDANRPLRECVKKLKGLVQGWSGKDLYRLCAERRKGGLYGKENKEF
ncbi:MAG: rRNA small subunit methyltransferase 1 [Desulfovibrio sp.]|nr:rRNA small subunit methyltransferase 1 [Desulfovibrio sp.]